MIQRIRDHNRLNGLRFSIGELGLFALVVAPFAVYYLLAARWLLAAIAIGIVANCLTVVILGIQALRRHEASIGYRGLRDPRQREAIARSYPHLQRDTILLTVTALLPYVLAGWTLLDSVTHIRKAPKDSA
jgi:hypothetical protein